MEETSYNGKRRTHASHRNLKAFSIIKDGDLIVTDNFELARIRIPDKAGVTEIFTALERLATEKTFRTVRLKSALRPTEDRTWRQTALM